MDTRQAKILANSFGFGSLLGMSTKIEKSNKSNSGYYSSIMYLAPYKLSGKNVCPFASNGCVSSCLNTAGHGVYDNVQNARIARTKMFFTARRDFIALLIHEVASAERKAIKNGLRLAIRLNGTSDIPWERVAPELFSLFPLVTFYDYTKNAKRMFSTMPDNYKLTFSRSESNESDCLSVLKNGGSVAVVFGSTLPKTWKRYKVIDGDITDERFLEKGGVIGLTAKAKAKKDTTGFVVRS